MSDIVHDGWLTVEADRREVRRLQPRPHDCLQRLDQGVFTNHVRPGTPCNTMSMLNDDPRMFFLMKPACTCRSRLGNAA